MTNKLLGGPLDGQEADAGSYEDVYERQVDLEGTWSVVRYERNDDGDFEYLSTKSVVDIANEAVAGADDLIDAEIVDEDPVDLSQMSVAEALEFLREDNARRVTFFFEESNGQVDLENSFDMLMVKTFVEHLMRAAGAKAYEAASLEFEDEKSKMLDKAEDQYNAFKAERESALARARLQMEQMPGGMPPPGAPGPIGSLPPRRIRRGG